MGPRDAHEHKEQDDDAAPLTPLGEFMRRRNADLGLSVAAVAQRVGISRATWYRIAHGESASPGVRVLRGLARIYRVRAAELFALAAYASAPAAASRTRPAGPTPEAGDALWRCRHERLVRSGSWLDVQLDLLNLSDRPWLDAEVRGLHQAWLPLGDQAIGRQPACGYARGVPPCCAPLAPTGPGEWVQARLTLRAPLAIGPFVYCLSLQTQPGALSTGTGTFVYVETR